MGYSLFGLIRVAHCVLRSADDVSVCQGSDDYQRLRPEAGARLVLGFSMPIAWPAVADGVAQGTVPNRAFSDRFPVTVATWLLMLAAVIVWNPGIGFFAYGTILGHKYVFCKAVGASILGILRRRAGLRLGRRLVSEGWRRRRGGGQGLGDVECKGRPW